MIDITEKTIFCKGAFMIYMVIGCVLGILACIWISSAKYYSGFGWIALVIGGYFIIKGREKMGLEKNK